MQVEVYCQTDVGLRRESNEDSFLIDEGLGLFVVADGMGGHKGGEVASMMAVEAVRGVVLKASQDKLNMNPRSVLTDAYRVASREIYDRSHKEGSDLQGMGTTLVSAYVHGETVYIANVGDSRAYLLSGKQIWQITEDHSLVNEQIRAGLLTEAEAKSFVGRNVITRSVGFEREVICDVIERKLQPGEMILMCSDGLSGLVTDQRIAELCVATPIPEIVGKCVDEAKKNGGDDNVTVLLIYAKPR